MIKGIDISVWNGKVDMEQAKRQGVQFAILKIISKKMEVDKQFMNNVEQCERLGINWGVYNYSYATTATKAKSDMLKVCEVLGGLKAKKYFKYGVWFDIEDDVQTSLSKTYVADIINAAQAVVESKGYAFGVYTGLAYYKAHIDVKKVKCKNWWIARYYKGYTKMDIDVAPSVNYKPMDGIVAWQYTSSGRFSPAICNDNSGSVDLNAMYMEMTEPKKTAVKKSYDRDVVKKKAVSYLGAREGDAKHKEILKIYNEHKPLPQGYIVKPSDSWCATYVSAMFIAAGYASIFPIECSCRRMIEVAKKMGVWVENDAYVPDVMDAVIYDWQDNGKGDNAGNPDHIGLVMSVDKKAGTMTVIEGNYNDMVKYRVIKINSKFIRGFVTPKFNSVKAEPKKESKPKVEQSKKTDDLKVDGVCGAETTRRAQKVFKTPVDGKISNQLKAYKSICKGIVSAEWSDTKKGGSVLVKAIQRWVGAKDDGYIGSDTIRKLQQKLGTPVDGKLDYPSQCIKAFQKWLNKH